MVSEAIPEAWFKKFNAVLSAIKIVLVLAFISAMILFFLTLDPSLTLLVKIDSLPTSLKAALKVKTDNLLQIKPELGSEFSEV